MYLEKQIKEAIEAEAEKLIERYQAYHNSLHLEHERRIKRVANAPPKEVKTPEAWGINKLHNPFYVRRKAGGIARSIAKKIGKGEYYPNAPHSQTVPKSGGGTRDVSVYQVPDAAVSALFYRRLLGKNRHRFSAFSYAYRNDRNVHFAIQDIAIDLQGSSRTFVAEFDFSDFFGSINHDYLLKQLDCNGFMVGEDERHVIRAFVASRGERGIPQGTSISLFIANMVCWELDKKLARCGVQFARYADDTVIWSPDYAKICEAFECIDDFSRETGVKINAAKSAGISLLKKKGMPAEMAPKDSFDFLGYSLSVDSVSIKNSRISKIKREISYILSKHLLQPLRQKPLRALIIPANGKDPALVSAMAEVRRYLYGGVTSTQILNYIHGRTKRLYFKGLMSYYPLVSDSDQLKALDGWLVSAVHRAVRERGKLLASHSQPRWHIFPFNVPRRGLVPAYQTNRLYEVPSLSLLHGALTRALTESGIERVMSSRSLGYSP
jgi:hypothetical protein